MPWHNNNNRDLPGSPVVKTSPSNARVVGLIPGRRAKISHASRPKNQNIKQKQYCNKFNTDFKNGPYLKTNNKKLQRCILKIPLKEINYINLKGITIVIAITIILGDSGVTKGSTWADGLHLRSHTRH